MTTENTITIDLKKYRPEDGGILDCWLELKGDDWLYVTGWEHWYRWTGTHWELDQCQRLQKQLQRLMDAMNKTATDELIRAKQAEQAEDKKTGDGLARFWREWVAATKRSKNRVASVEGLAQAHRAIAADQLNTLNALNLKNGTLDLDTLELRPHNRDDYLTYQLCYEYSAEALAPRFEQFIREVFVSEDTTETDLELCQLVQESMGYSLTVDTKHEAMFWLSGDGGNGKTVLITVLHWLLNGMAASVDFSTLGQPGNYDLADAQGKRVLFSTESERGGKLAEGYIKRIVSGERINARAIYGKPFEFKAIAKLWWAMNDKPVIRDTGNSVWRRLKLIPFNRTFTEAERDPDLLDKLRDELPGVLNFALDGLRRLRLRGRLPESSAVTSAIKEYRHESNPVAQWLDENTIKISQCLTSGKTLYTDYEQWCKANGRQAMNSVHWGRELTRLKAQSKTTGTGRVFAIGLLQPTPTPAITG